MAKPQANTTSRGLGHIHQTQRRRLLYNHIDGTPCWWCDKPMYREAAKNWDSKPLEADHSKSRRDHGPNQLADRLLHSQCNRQRGAGDRDHQRPAIQPAPPPPTAARAKPFTWA